MMTGKTTAQRAKKPIRRTVTHPYGYASIGNRDLAFIRISKNASTFIADSLNLRQWERVDRLDRHRFLCALRDPEERFLSSVGETLGRIGIFSDDADVLVDLRIRRAINELCQGFDGDIAGFLLEYLNIIDRFGFFDAHHEPQHYFLVDAEEAGRNIEFFNVSDADQALEALARTYKVTAGRRNSSYQKISKPRFKADIAYQRICEGLGKFNLAIDGPYELRNRLNSLYAEDYSLLARAECRRLIF